jgi:hypothetical protein
MNKRGPRYPKEEFARRGWEWYQNVVKPKVFAGNKGKHVIIDIETGEFEVDDDSLAATERLYARLPDAQPWGIKIGYLASTAHGGQPLPEDHS